MIVEEADLAPLRAVLDTSSLYSPRLRRELQQAAQLDLFVGVWSPWIIAELNRVLTWQWIEYSGGDTSRPNERRCSEAAKTMMELLLATFELVNPRPPYPPAWDKLGDEWDLPIWAAAVEGRARYVVSENSSDFPPAREGRHTHEGIEYVTGRAFLDLLDS